MVALTGRKIEFEWNMVAIPGVREKGIALNGAPIDVTSDEDNGKRSLLTLSAQDEVNITISGVTKTQTLKKDWFDGTRTRTVLITYPLQGLLGTKDLTIAGSFYLSSYTDTGPYNDAVTFSAELMSTGPVVFDDNGTP